MQTHFKKVFNCYVYFFYRRWRSCSEQSPRVFFTQIPSKMQYFSMIILQNTETKLKDMQGLENEPFNLKELSHLSRLCMDPVYSGSWKLDWRDTECWPVCAVSTHYKEERKCLKKNLHFLRSTLQKVGQLIRDKSHYYCLQ